jgi:hypothetical protein
MSYHQQALSSPSKEIYVLSESPCVKVNGNCYRKVPGFFGAETHNVSSIESESEHCQICEGDLKTVNIFNSATINKKEECLLIDLSVDQNSQINIYNKKTTYSHSIKRVLNDYIINYDSSDPKTLSNHNDVIYIENDFLTYKFKLIKNENSAIICATEDPFNERCNKKVGINHSDLGENFQNLQISFVKNSEIETTYHFNHGSDLSKTLEEIDSFLHKLYTSSIIDIKFKISSDKKYIFFWRPFGDDINESNILLSTLNLGNKTSLNLIDLSDHDFDGIPNFLDTHPYGGLFAEKTVFSSSDENFKDFNYGDSLSLSLSPALKEIYTIDNFSSIEDAFKKLSSLINSDFNNKINNYYSTIQADIFSNDLKLLIWDPCSLESPQKTSLFISKKQINLSSKTFFDNQNVNSLVNGPYFADSGALEISLENKLNNLIHAASGKYFSKSNKINGKLAYEQLNGNHQIFWQNGNFRLFEDSNTLSSLNISFKGSIFPESFVNSYNLGLYNHSLNLGLNGYPTYTNNKGFYLFNFSSGNWFISNKKYGITDNNINDASLHISESFTC